MSKVDELKTEIGRVPEEDFTELVKWLSEKDWERWDEEIEADSEAENWTSWYVRHSRQKQRELSRTCEADNQTTKLTRA
jgi:hypothetical protein